MRAIWSAKLIKIFRIIARINDFFVNFDPEFQNSEILESNKYRKEPSRSDGGYMSRHPVLANTVIIMIVAVVGILIAYLSIAIFTKHGESDVVPGVENLSYTEAISRLHDHGFKIEIRDSLYMDNVKPGYVIEQFPKANSVVKPGRKIFLYINAVHPKEVIIDDDNNPREDALKSFSFRQGMARLEELGFKNIRIVRVLGANDCIVKIMANGHTIKKMEKVPVNARLTVEVQDGRMSELRDSLQNAEFLRYSTEEEYQDETQEETYDSFGQDEEEENPYFEAEP